MSLTRYLTSMIIAVLLAAAPGGARLSAQDSTTIRELLRLEDAWGKAEITRNGSAVARLLSDDFIFTTRRAFQGKAAYIASIIADSTAWLSAGSTERVVRVYGHAAIITGIWTARIQAGQSVDTVRARFTSVWIRQADGRWLCATSQSAPEPRSP